MFARIREDVRSVLERDPAARSWLEVLLCYPGLWAVWYSPRLAPALAYEAATAGARPFAGRPLLHRRRHPSRRAARPPALHRSRDRRGHRRNGDRGQRRDPLPGRDAGRHRQGPRQAPPTVCDGVFIGNNANVLGNITVGENSRVGAGSVVLSDVPPNSTVVGVPAHIVYRNGERVLITDPHDVKDPLSDALIALSARVEELEDKLGAHVRPRRALRRRRSRAHRLPRRAGSARRIRLDGRRNLIEPIFAKVL